MYDIIIIPTIIRIFYKAKTITILMLFVLKILNKLIYLKKYVDNFILR
jgi:hypothetical protein